MPAYYNEHDKYAAAWLCSRCNTGIGLFDDSAAMLADAVTYLRFHE